MKLTNLKITFSTLALSISIIFNSFAFYNSPESIKGIVTEHVDMADDLVDLGVKQVVCNLTMSRLNDEQEMVAFDRFINKLDDRDITITVVFLNDYQTSKPHLLPVSSSVSGTAYYSFNATTQEGIDAISNVADRLGSRYGNKVSNWVIGNEINDRSTWNYIGIDDTTSYSENYAKGFRIFYNKIKSYNSEARFFIPFEMRWNCVDDVGTNGRYKAKEMLPILNNLLKDTDYGIAWHPYPQEKDQLDLINQQPDCVNNLDTPLINFKNLNVLTDFMQQSDLLSPDGKVRHLILSEFGFSSEYGEDLQADALTQAFEIAKNNPYVEGFFLNKQVDAPEEVAHYGLINSSKTERKTAWYTYQNLK